ncbi:hypothetical protein TEGL_11090 [Terrisporobacter glycolicus ATCC 14880 = DSM 1288]|uniref:GIY-YIG domain-containing protein n=1 Tax=Terrisporobacter glycolicus ATCC 14880 = DSM 1288 TaxID=1121315 RepID=A0ABZ2ETF2_9FIRM
MKGLNNKKYNDNYINKYCIYITLNRQAIKNNYLYFGYT